MSTVTLQMSDLNAKIKYHNFVSYVKGHGYSAMPVVSKIIEREIDRIMSMDSNGNYKEIQRLINYKGERQNDNL